MQQHAHTWFYYVRAQFSTRHHSLIYIKQTNKQTITAEAIKVCLYSLFYLHLPYR